MRSPKSLDAEKLVYLTDVAGVYADWPDEASLISRIDVDGLEKLIADGKITEGMIPKLESCVHALRNGVRGAHILDGRLPARAAARVLHEGRCRNHGVPGAD